MADKKYIVSLSESNQKIDLEFWNELSKLRGVTYWHWLPTTWLIVDNSNQLDILKLTSMVENHYPDQRFLISQVSIEIWRGRGPMSEDKNMFNWLRKFWIRTKENFV